MTWPYGSQSLPLPPPQTSQSILVSCCLSQDSQFCGSTSPSSPNQGSQSPGCAGLSLPRCTSPSSPPSKSPSYVAILVPVPQPYWSQFFPKRVSAPWPHCKQFPSYTSPSSVALLGPVTQRCWLQWAVAGLRPLPLLALTPPPCPPELCGTPGYLAPEILKCSMDETHLGYGHEVDL